MRIKIMDRSYEVVLNTHGGRDHGTDSSGSASHWFQKIWLDADTRPFDGVEGDLWHEIIEMVDKNQCLRMTHEQITAIGVAVHQVIEDNKQFFNEFYSELTRIIQGG